MKKLTALLLATLLLAGMGTAAFASGPSGGVDMGGTSGSPIGDIDPVSLPINGSFQTIAGGDPVYQVRLEWSGLEFTYHPRSNGTWDPDDLAYIGGNAAAKWTSGEDAASGSIKITNHSNADIAYKIEASMESATVGGSVRMRWSASSDMSGAASVSPSAGLTGRLLAAETGFDPDSATFYFLPNGTPTTDFGTDVSIGSITVSVSAA